MFSNAQRIWSLLNSNCWGLLTLVLTWAIFFSPLLLGQQVYFIDDLKVIYYPLEHAYAEHQAGGELPQWNQYFGFGHPLLSWGQLGFFTPIHFILRTLSLHPLNLLQVSIVLYFLLGLLGMFTFLRLRQLSQPAATLGAIVFTFCGFHIGHLFHVNFYSSTLLLPWLLIAIYAVIRQPSLARAAALSLIAAAITVSGQPQVILYTFIIAAIFGTTLTIESWRKCLPDQRLKYSGRLIGVTLLSGLLALCLSSSALLPLLESLPQSDRAGGLPIEELFEFSYPPWHTITLIAPYFYGQGLDYWGAKDFHELAAFIGIVPLLLAGVSLAFWREYRAEKTAALILLVISFVLATGKYSPVYRSLVEQHYLTSIAVSSRFVFFFDVAIAILGALGLQHLIIARRYSWQRMTSAALAGLTLAGLLTIIPLTWSLPNSELARQQVQTYISSVNSEVTLLLGGLIVFVLAIAVSPHSRTTWPAWLLVAITGSTLIVFGWDYIPRTPRNQAFIQSPFAHELETYQQTHGYPARLYSRAELFYDEASTNVRPTDKISPLFSVHQPVTVTQPTQPTCLKIPFYAVPSSRGYITITIRPELNAPAIRESVISADDIRKNTQQEICFTTSKSYVVSLTSDIDSGINTYYTPTDLAQEFAYFVRIIDPTTEQLSRSRKSLRLTYQEIYHDTIDEELNILSRHLQVTAASSSARWIGALAIRPYREFIETFFANDRTGLMDGDGVHIFQRYRSLLDMAGITHIIQTLPRKSTDRLPEHNFPVVREFESGGQRFRLYANPQAYPKAFMVPYGEFKFAADETRFAMMQPTFDPQQIVYLSGPGLIEDMPPRSTEPLNTNATITHYESTRIDLTVETSRPAFLIVNDATTPQWQTYIDNKPAPQLVANSMFKAALIPTGQHTVTFRYESPAARRSILLTAGAIIVIMVTSLISFLYHRSRLKYHDSKSL